MSHPIISILLPLSFPTSQVINLIDDIEDFFPDYMTQVGSADTDAPCVDAGMGPDAEAIEGACYKLACQYMEVKP